MLLHCGLIEGLAGWDISALIYRTPEHSVLLLLLLLSVLLLLLKSPCEEIEAVQGESARRKLFEHLAEAPKKDQGEGELM